MSLLNQEAHLSLWLSRSGYQACFSIIEETDTVVVPYKKRPELQKAIKLAVDNKIPLVTVALTRIARSVRELSQIFETLESGGADLIVIDQSINTTSPMGKVAFSAANSVLNFLTDIGREEFAERKMNDGRLRPSARFGKRIVKGKMEDDLWEIRLIDLILYMYYNKKMSYNKIALSLKSLGIVSKRLKGKRSSARWCRKTVSRILIHATEQRVRAWGKSLSSKQAYRVTRSSGTCIQYRPISEEQYNMLVNGSMKFDEITHSSYLMSGLQTLDTGEAGESSLITTNVPSQ